MFVSYVYTCTVFALKKEQSLNTDLTSHFTFLKRKPTERRARTGWADSHDPVDCGPTCVTPWTVALQK